MLLQIKAMFFCILIEDQHLPLALCAFSLEFFTSSIHFLPSSFLRLFHFCFASHSNIFLRLISFSVRFFPCCSPKTDHSLFSICLTASLLHISSFLCGKCVRVLHSGTIQMNLYEYHAYGLKIHPLPTFPSPILLQ